jgi:hypothetical protein
MGVFLTGSGCYVNRCLLDIEEQPGYTLRDVEIGSKGSALRGLPATGQRSVEAVKLPNASKFFKESL